MKNKIVVYAGSALLILGFVLFFCGFGDVRAEESGDTVTFYHKHSGDSVNGGGCYGKRCTSERECGSYNLSIWDNGQGSYNYLCRECGYQWTYAYELIGEHCRNRLTSVYYERNCGLDGIAAVSLSCTKSQSGWTKELDLNASCRILDGSCKLSGTPYVWNGSASSSSVFHVTENGTYTLGLQAEGADTSQVITISVDNIDHQAPVIQDFSPAQSGWCRETTLSVIAADGESGLASQPYSFDGGATWTDQSGITVTNNGTYSVTVRDAVGNQSTAQVQVTMIDRTEPMIQVTTSPGLEDWYEGDLTITVQASDAESGLAERAYSFNGGSVFSAGNTYKISSGSVINVVVTDRAGNRKQVTVNAVKKNRPQTPETPAGGNTQGTGVSSAGNNAIGNGQGNDVSGIGNSQGDDPVAAENGQRGSTSAPGETEVTAQTGAGTGAFIQNSGRNGNENAQSGHGAAGGQSGKGNTNAGGMQNGKPELQRNEEGEDQNTQAGIGANWATLYYPDGMWQGVPVNGKNLPEKAEKAEKQAGEEEGEESGKSEEGACETEAEEEITVWNEALSSPASQNSYRIYNSADNIWKMLLTGVGIALSGIGMAALSFLFLGVPVMAKNRKGRFCIVGVTRLRQKGQKKEIRLSERMVRKACTNEFRIRLPFFKGKENKEEKIRIAYRSVNRDVPMQKTIQVRLRNE